MDEVKQVDDQKHFSVTLPGAGRRGIAAIGCTVINYYFIYYLLASNFLWYQEN